MSEDNYADLEDDALAERIDYLSRRARMARRRGLHDAASMWEDNAQQAQDELDARKDKTDHAE